MRSAVTAAVKQAGKALKEEVRVAVKDAAKEAAREATKEAFAQSLKALRALSNAARASPAEARFFGSAAAAPVQAPIQTYPTLCACDEDARAEVTVDGQKVYTCHSCAPRGQGLRDYKTVLEAKKLGIPVPRARPKYTSMGAVKENQMAGKPVRRTRKRRAKTRAKTRARLRRGGRD